MTKALTPTQKHFCPHFTILRKVQLKMPYEMNSKTTSTDATYANTTPTSRGTTFRSFSTWTAQPDLVLNLYSQLATCRTHQSLDALIAILHRNRPLVLRVWWRTYSILHVNHGTRFQTAMFPKPRIGTLKFPLRLAPCFFLRGRQAKLIHKHW